MRNPYEVLGVSPGATDEEIKRHTENSADSIIRMRMSTVRTRRLQKKNLKKFSRHIHRS